MHRAPVQPCRHDQGRRARLDLVKLDGKQFAKPGKPNFTLTVGVAKLRAGPHKLTIKASDKFKNSSLNVTEFIRCA